MGHQFNWMCKMLLCVDNHSVDIFLEVSVTSTNKKCIEMLLHRFPLCNWYVDDDNDDAAQCNRQPLHCQQLFSSQFIFFNLLPYRFQLIQFWMRARVRDYPSLWICFRYAQEYTQSIKIGNNNEIDTKFQSLKSAIRHMPKMKLNCSGKWNWIRRHLYYPRDRFELNAVRIANATRSICTAERVWLKAKGTNEQFYINWHEMRISYCVSNWSLCISSYFASLVFA